MPCRRRARRACPFGHPHMRLTTCPFRHIPNSLGRTPSLTPRTRQRPPMTCPYGHTLSSTTEARASTRAAARHMSLRTHASRPPASPVTAFTPGERRFCLPPSRATGVFSSRRRPGRPVIRSRARPPDRPHTSPHAGLAHARGSLRERLFSPAGDLVRRSARPRARLGRLRAGDIVRRRWLDRRCRGLPRVARAASALPTTS